MGDGLDSVWIPGSVGSELAEMEAEFVGDGWFRARV